MVKIKTAYIIAFIVILSVFASSCSGGDSGVPPNEKIDFTDRNGISFSLQTTSCSDNKSNGRISLKINGTNSYLYSTDRGRSYKKARNAEAALTGVFEGSYSFCVTESENSENVTDIYTVYVEDILRPYPISVTAVSAAEKIIDDGKITLQIENFGDGTEYEASLDGWETMVNFSGNTAVFDSLGQDMYSVCVRDKNNTEIASPTLNVPVVHSEIGTSAQIAVAAILQTPELPTGCEVTSLTMLLNHIGFDVDKLTLADGYLPKGEYRKTDFNKVFVGDPRSRQAYGCTAGVIAETAEKFLNEQDKENKWQVKNITGCTADTLYSAVKWGYPVVVWGSIDMEEIIQDYVTWTDESTGNIISWHGKEHCLLLTGYDAKEKLVYVNDPLRGQVTYDMKTFEKRFDDLDRNAIIIIER